MPNNLLIGKRRPRIDQPTIRIEIPVPSAFNTNVVRPNAYPTNANVHRIVNNVYTRVRVLINGLNINFTIRPCGV